MIVIVAQNITGTKPDGTSDYDVQIGVGSKLVAQFEVTGHVRKDHVAKLVTLIAAALEAAVSAPATVN